MFKLILAQIRRIPRGKVATYGDVAYAAGFPGAARQVAWALRSPEAVAALWQRVIGSGGKILLTGEHGFEQRMRLQSEGVRFNGLRIAMDEHHHSFFGSKRNPKAVNKTGAKRTPAKKKAGTRKGSARRFR